MSAPGDKGTIVGDAFTAGGKKVEILPVPENADIEKPVECLNDFTFTNRNGVIQVFKDFLVQGELVVHGSITVHGFSEFKGTARPRFGKKYSKEAKNVKNESAQGTPVAIPQKLVADGNSYIYREGLTCLNKDKIVIIYGDLVVFGNFTAEGAARFHEKQAHFGGGVTFERDPVIDED